MTLSRMGGRETKEKATFRKLAEIPTLRKCRKNVRQMERQSKSMLLNYTEQNLKGIFCENAVKL